MTGTWEELVSKIKDKLDIVEVISEQVVLKKRGQSYWGLCPFHKDKNPSFCVTPHLGIYKCFSCGEAGDALKFIMKTRNIEFKDLIIELADRFGFGSKVTLKRRKYKRIKRSNACSYYGCGRVL